MTSLVQGQEKGREYHVPVGCECVELFAEGSVEQGALYLIREFSNRLPFLIAGPIAVPLTGDIDGVIYLTVDMPYTDIHWLDLECFVSGESGLFYCENNGEKHLLIGTDGMITSFGLSTEGIFFIEKDCLLYKRFGEGGVMAIIHADKAIGPLSVIDNICFFSVGKDIYAYRESNLVKIYSAPSEVLALAVHPDGSVFFGTGSSVNCITPDLREVEIVHSPTRSLDLIGDNLYISFLDGSLSMITNISLFCQSEPTD